MKTIYKEIRKRENEAAKALRFAESKKTYAAAGSSEKKQQKTFFHQFFFHLKNKFGIPITGGVFLRKSTF